MAIYLDNAATSFPKPPQVAEKMAEYITQVGAPINRSVYAAAQEAYSHAQQCYHEAHEAFSGRLSQLEAQLQQLPGGSAQACRERCRSAMEHWDELEDAKRLRQQADSHLRTVTSMAETAPAPEFEDQLTFSPGETESRITAALLEQLNIDVISLTIMGRTISQPVVRAAQKRSRISTALCFLK